MNAVMDEIGEIVRDNITTPKEARRIKALADDFLPCERMGDQWPQNIAADIDLELATEFTIINLNAILRLTCKRIIALIVGRGFWSASPKAIALIRPAHLSASTKCRSRGATM